MPKLLFKKPTSEDLDGFVTGLPAPGEEG
jgi:hypothetical protein